MMQEAQIMSSGFEFFVPSHSCKFPEIQIAPPQQLHNSNARLKELSKTIIIASLFPLAGIMNIAVGLFGYQWRNHGQREGNHPLQKIPISLMPHSSFFLGYALLIPNK
ncbi:hypothetical protein EJD97_006564 [Solanum chilense]|uniref:Uncharacterized protein n=1 Tax=Solanum chilense TaxID=4083 RepID=A0A6N2BTH4_SOLCI|nr:hypothetical protein EJD97_006564 [Solanum chilense]